jgi:aspartate/methionine/tyrosine aminotransferase
LNGRDDTLSRAARAIEPTLIREFRAKATDESLDLGIGQTDLKVPEPLRHALVEHAESHRAPYSDNLGLPALRTSVGDHLGTSADEVMITCGVQEGLAVAIQGLVDPGDRVLVPDPGFPAYPNLVRSVGAEPVRYHLDPDDGFRVDSESLKRAAEKGFSAIIINNPSNPTGRHHQVDELEELLEAANAADAVWISDEIYRHYVYTSEFVSVADLASSGDLPGMRIGGLSKSMHIMGWRIGWATAPADWIRGLKPLHQHLVTCAPTSSQRVAIAALDRFDALFRPTLQEFRRRRDYATARVEAFDGLSATPAGGAFYLFIDVRAYSQIDGGSLELATDLLDDQDLVLIPGRGFGPRGEGFLRLAYTRPVPVLEEAFDRLEAFLKTLPMRT